MEKSDRNLSKLQLGDHNIFNNIFSDFGDFSMMIIIISCDLVTKLADDAFIGKVVPVLN
jgi:hypothetical protein